MRRDTQYDDDGALVGCSMSFKFPVFRFLATMRKQDRLSPIFRAGCYQARAVIQPRRKR